MANNNDLTFLKSMYQKIVENMEQNHIFIWDEVYPSEFLKEDIDRKQLYILEDEGTMKAAFALCDSNEGDRCVKWPLRNAKACYIDRFGVNVDHLRQGIGSKALLEAAALSHRKGVESLRLFVVESNLPAIKLYEKNGFIRAQGIYEEKIDEDLSFREYGYEINVEIIEYDKPTICCETIR